jgi:DNA-binding transcriptional LysR family regulator
MRVGIIDASYDSMPQILHEVQARYPGLVIHQVEASVPDQYQQLIDGRLDIGIGRAALAPPQVASQLFRLLPAISILAIKPAARPRTIQQRYS